MYREANIIFHRLHSGHYAGVYMDAADEVGMLLSPDRLMAQHDYAETPEYLASIKRVVDDNYNHPSIITYSLGNEMLSNGNGSRLEKAAPILSKIYDAYKSVDKTRPITACSGSGCIIEIPEEDYAKWPKEDYHDLHDYRGSGSGGHMIRLYERIPKHYECYQKTNPGTTKPMVNGECGGFWNWHSDIFKPLRNKNWPDIDRRQYVDFVGRLQSSDFPEKRKPKDWMICCAGMGTYAEDPDAVPAYAFRRLLEIYRAWGMKQVNYQLFSVPNYFSGAPEYFSHARSREAELVRATLREMNQPVFVVCDRLDTHLFAGKSVVLRLIAMNDSLHDIGKATLSVVLKDDDRVRVKLLVSIPHFTQAEHHRFEREFEIPADLASGHYSLVLTISDEHGKHLSKHDYRVHVLGKAPSAKGVQTRKVLVYVNEKEQGTGLSKVLDKLSITWRRTSDFSELGNHEVLIIGPNSFDKTAKEHTDKIKAFVQNGGRLLMLCQNVYGANPFVSGLLYRRVTAPSSMTDIVTLTHPIFQGLERKDFHLLNGLTYTSDRVLSPLTPAVLAATYRIRGEMSEVGMSVGEIALGQGVYMFSQIKALENYENDSVAARYLNNLLRYCVSQEWKADYAVSISAQAEKFKKPVVSSCFFFDLRKNCNMGFVDEVANDHKGGGSDQGPVGDLRIVPTGEQTFADIPFEIVNPANNEGKSCIVLASDRLQGRVNDKSWLPKRAVDIKVGHKLSHLYFLVAPTFTPYTQQGLKIATIIFTYEWGGAGAASGASLDLVVGRNVTDWTVLTSGLPEAVVAFEQRHPLWDRNVGALVIPWENPIPNEVIESLSIVSTGDAVPIFLAITGAKEVKSGQTGLVSGHWKFDEDKDSRIKDSLGHYADAKLPVSMDWVDGKVGKAIRFDEARDFIDIERPPRKPTLGESPSFSISAWIKVDKEQLKKAAGIISTYLNEDKEPPYRGFSLNFRSWDGRWHLYFGLVSPKVTRSDKELNDGLWHHVVAVYNGENQQATLYVDGLKQARSGKSEYLPSPAPQFRIGKHRTGWGASFNGVIDELKIFDEAIAEDKIAALYESSLE